MLQNTTKFDMNPTKMKLLGFFKCSHNKVGTCRQLQQHKSSKLYDEAWMIQDIYSKILLQENGMYKAYIYFAHNLDGLCKVDWVKTSNCGVTMFTESFQSPGEKHEIWYFWEGVIYKYTSFFSRQKGDPPRSPHLVFMTMLTRINLVF